MCCRLSNSYHCLTFLTVLGLLQVIVSLPILVLSLLTFFQTSLGHLLSPYWCGFILLIAGLVALLIRPTRLASIICIHVVLNSVSIITCLVAGGLTGLYGTSVHLTGFDLLTDMPLGGSGSGQTSTTRCIFADSSPLYSSNFRTALSPLDTIVPSCEDLENVWTYLVANMSLCFIGLLVSMVAIVTNCITPCLEESYSKTWRPDDSHDS